MKNSEFKKAIKAQYGEFYLKQFDLFFEEAIRLADKGKFKESLKVGKDAFILSKYTDISYEKIYLVGMLCQAYLDNKQPEMANVFFRLGMQMIDENHIKYSEDINAFLDIKILIDTQVYR